MPSHLLLDLMKDVGFCSSLSPQAAGGPVTLQQSMTDRQVHAPVDHTCPVKGLPALNALTLLTPR